MLFTHNETATGVTSDVAGMRKALNDTRHPALLMVDGVSSIGSIDFRMDEWGVDCAVTGSQKGLMLPAGLGIVAVSPKAAALYDRPSCPGVFFDFGDMKKANATGYFPYTPSLPLLYGLRESLDHAVRGRGWRTSSPGTTGWPRGPARRSRRGGSSSAPGQPKWYSDTVSAIMVPAGINGAEVIDVAYRRYNLALGAGLARMAGRLFRIGHLGDLNELHAARRHRRRGDGHARRGRQGHAGQRRRRGARSTGAARPSRSSKRELPPRAPDAQPARREGEGHRRRGAMSHTRYEPARQRLQRSELAVPGSNPGMFEKALDGEADYIFLDLEDAVAPGDKEQARKNVIQALLEHDWRGRGKTISVRINGIDTHYMYRDVVDVVEQAGHRLDTILIPKVGVPADVYMVDAMVTQIEEAKGIPHRARDRRADRDGPRHGECRGHRRSPAADWRRCTSASRTTRRAAGRARS